MSLTKSHVVAKTQSLVLTPKRATGFSTPTTPRSSPGTGTFRHPRTTEIAARQAATILTFERARTALLNLIILLLSVVFSDYVHAFITPVVSLCISPESWWFSAPLLGIQGYLCLRIILALRPAIPYLAKKDDCSDIPLTPTQRALLGLPPSTNPTPASAATGVAYITPPRYRYVSGSSSDANSDAAINDRRSVSANYSNSPLSASRYTLGLSPTPQSNRRTPGSPFQPSPTASPLFHKAANQKLQRFPDADFSASTQSFGHSTGSGLGRSQSLRERSRRDSFEPTSPTAGTSNPQMVPGVNYKWLYAKWRTLPKSESFGSFGL